MQFEKWNYKIEAMVLITELEIDTIIRIGRESSDPDFIEAVGTKGFVQAWKEQAATQRPLRKSVNHRQLALVTEILESDHDNLSIKLHQEFQDLLTRLPTEDERING